MLYVYYCLECIGVRARTPSSSGSSSGSEDPLYEPSLSTVSRSKNSTEEGNTSVESVPIFADKTGTSGRAVATTATAALKELLF